jgi:hypothetical protein
MRGWLDIISVRDEVESVCVSVFNPFWSPLFSMHRPCLAEGVDAGKGTPLVCVFVIVCVPIGSWRALAPLAAALMKEEAVCVSH